MKTLMLLWALLPVMMGTTVQGQGLQALFSNASFHSQAEGPYVETYLKVFGPSAQYVTTPRNTYQASLQVTLLFKIGDKIVDFRKYNLLSAELEDTLKGLPDFIDQQRILLPYGVYQLDLSIADNNSKETAIGRTCSVPMEFPSSVNIMSFYTELYNLDKKIGDNQDFLFRYYIESSKDQVVMDDFAKFQRQKTASVNPLLVTIPITDLSNGIYNFVVEAIDRNNAILAKHEIGFQRSNPGLQLDVSDIKAIDITSTFAERIMTPDSLKFYLESLNPIGTMTENQYVIKVLKTNDIRQMQKFLFGFWKTRNDQYPEAEWNNYKAQVLAIEESYKTRVKHGYETDMGYTWLKYGTPDQVEDSKHEPNAVPYIIWQYFHIENQSNVRFVFANPHLVGTEYFLAYSDARDNRYNTGWNRDLYERTTGFGSQGGWGSNFLSNFRR